MEARPARLLSWALTGLFAIAVSASVFRIPIQVSDSAEIIEQTDRAPSVAAAFTDGLHASRTMLRPMRQAGTKLLLDAAHVLGDRYNLAFRGFHAASAALLIVLFTTAARPRDALDAAALGFALLVLTGLHTFTGMMREAYPINHFLNIAIYCLVALLLARSRGGLVSDIAACACFAVASLTLESGLVVLPMVIAMYWAGLRGISRNAIVVMLLLAAGYVALRVAGLHMIGNAVGERQTGFGTAMLSTADLRARFGDRPWLLYAYTIVCSALTVPLSQPVAGQWTAFAPWDPQAWPVFFLNDIGTSLAATAVVVWYMTRRSAGADLTTSAKATVVRRSLARRRKVGPYDPSRTRRDTADVGAGLQAGPRHWRDPIPLAMLAVLAGSAVLSYAYAKTEIMSAAGVFYALVVYLAVRELLVRLKADTTDDRGRTAASIRQAAPVESAFRRTFILIIILFVSSAWAWRAAGLQYRLQRGAFDARSEWVLRMPPYHDPPVPAADVRLTPRMQDEALHRGRTNPYLLWPRYARLWGEY